MQFQAGTAALFLLKGPAELGWHEFCHSGIFIEACPLPTACAINIISTGTYTNTIAGMSSSGGLKKPQ